MSYTSVEVGQLVGVPTLRRPREYDFVKHVRFYIVMGLKKWKADTYREVLVMYIYAFVAQPVGGVSSVDMARLRNDRKPLDL